MAKQQKQLTQYNLTMFRNLITNILMWFMKPGVDRAVESMRNDPEIKQKFKDLENALQDLKDATERKEEYSNSEERKSALKSLGVKRIKY
jgi:hypothetical protein